jgi:uncharacterized membrane protein YfcA
VNIIALLAGLFSGVIGAMGMGGGAVLIIYLTLFAGVEQLRAQGINLIFFIPIGVTALIIYCKKGKIKWKTALPLAAGGLIGSFLGLFLTSVMGADLIGKIFGGFLIVLGLLEVFKRKNVKNQNTSCKKEK